jgi:hypothetical protein
LSEIGAYNDFDGRSRIIFGNDGDEQFRLAAVHASGPPSIRAENDANALLMTAAPDLLHIAESIKITGPDADGLVWLQIEDDGIDGLMAVNLGKRDRVVAQVALLFEESRRAAVAKARGDA